MSGQKKTEKPLQALAAGATAGAVEGFVVRTEPLLHYVIQAKALPI